MDNANLLGQEKVSAGTAAYVLGISHRTVRYYCEIGELRGYKLGKRWHILRSSLDELVERRADAAGIKESAVTAVPAVPASVSKNSLVKR